MMVSLARGSGEWSCEGKHCSLTGGRWRAMASEVAVGHSFVPWFLAGGARGGSIEGRRERTSERASERARATFLPYRFSETILLPPAPPARPSVAKTIRNGSRDFFFPSFLSLPLSLTYLSIGEGSEERGRAKVSRAWMLQRRPFLAAVAVTLRASSIEGGREAR